MRLCGAIAFWTLSIFGRALSAEPAGVLTLETFLARVESSYPKLRSAALEPRLAAAKALEKQGAFDPSLNLKREELEFEAAPGKTKTKHEASIDLLTWEGAKLFAGKRLGELAIPARATSGFGEENRYFVGFKVPLLRGGRINEKNAAVRQARIESQLAEDLYGTTRIDLLQRAADAYWDWILARRTYDVVADVLELARARASLVSGRVKEGDLPAIDELEARQEAARRSSVLVKARRDVDKSALKMSLYLWQEDGLPSQAPAFRDAPPTDPEPVRLSEGEIAQAQMNAAMRRPELGSLLKRREIVRIDRDLARNLAQPAIDISFNPGRVSDQDAIDSVGETMRAKLNISVPLSRREAQGRLEAARVKLAKLDLEEASERQRIAVEVADTANAVNLAHDRYLATRAEVELARQIQRLEHQRYAQGEGTLFLVNQRERATAEAGVKVIEARIDYHQALARYRLAAGLR